MSKEINFQSDDCNHGAVKKAANGSNADKVSKSSSALKDSVDLPSYRRDIK
jgi:hypothetical protein